MTTDIDDQISSNAYFRRHQTNKDKPVISSSNSVPDPGSGVYGGIVFEDEIGLLLDSDEEERLRPVRFVSNCVLPKPQDDSSRKRKAPVSTSNDGVDFGFGVTSDSIGTMCDEQTDCQGPEWSVKRRNCTPHTHVHLRPESIQLACAGRCIESRELIAGIIESSLNQAIAKMQAYNEQYLARAVALLDKRLAPFASRG